MNDPTEETRRELLVSINTQAADREAPDIGRGGPDVRAHRPRLVGGDDAPRSWILRRDGRTHGWTPG